MAPRISLCMIVKDEEAMLPACLASVAGAVDEIVVVDTGSRDRTKAIAIAAGARVSDYVWRGDFAHARNEALRHASGDFILVLDADERLAPGAAQVIRDAVATATWDAALLPVHDATSLDAPPPEVVAGAWRHGSPLMLMRLLRNAGGLAWEGIVHEAVDGWLLARGTKVTAIDAHVVHYGHITEIQEGRNKRERNLTLLRRRCEAEPDNVVPLGYLVAELMGADREDEARRTVEVAWALVDRQPRERSIHRVAVLRALLALRAGEPEIALECARRVEARQGEHPDWHYLRGCALELQALAAERGSARRRKLSLDAARSFRAAAGLRGVARIEQFVEGADGIEAVVRLGHSLLVAGEPRAALVAFEAALAENAEYRPAMLGRAEGLLDSGDAQGALLAVEPLLGATADGWLLAAAAALAAGSPRDASTFFDRARERLKGGLATHRRERFRLLEAALTHRG